MRSVSGEGAARLQMPGVGSVAFALRVATRDVHKRLEGALPLTNAGLTPAAYCLIVEAFYGFYAPIEGRLALIEGLPIVGRAKVGKLRADLRALGSSDSRVEALPLCACLPNVAARARALGCLYVLEGATLGGRVIVQALRDHLGITPATGASFFEGYGVATGGMWRSTLAHIEAAEGAGSEIIRGAVDTFETFERWLSARSVLE